MRIEVNGVRIGPELIRAEAAILRRNARELGHEVTPDDGSRFIFRNVHHEDERESRLAEIKQVREVLETGARFAETADHFSDCPGNGGRIGYIQHGEMVPVFDDVVFNSQVGQITPVFPTRFRFHIALVAEMLPEGIPPFKRIASAVKSAFIERKRSAVIAHRIEQLWALASIREVSGA